MKVDVGAILPKFLWQNFQLAQVTLPAGFEFCISVQVVDDDAEQVVDGRHQLKKEINANALSEIFFNLANGNFPLKMFQEVSGELVVGISVVDAGDNQSNP